MTRWIPNVAVCTPLSNGALVTLTRADPRPAVQAAKVPSAPAGQPEDEPARSRVSGSCVDGVTCGATVGLDSSWTPIVFNQRDWSAVWAGDVSASATEKSKGAEARVSGVVVPGV
jgi:hypothetical protein